MGTRAAALVVTTLLLVLGPAGAAMAQEDQTPPPEVGTGVLVERAPAAERPTQVLGTQAVRRRPPPKPAPAAVARPRLARTGSTTAPLTMVGFGLLLAGALLVKIGSAHDGAHPYSRPARSLVPS